MLITEERRHLYRVLDETMLPAGVAEKLAGLGITTLDELRDYWNYGNRQDDEKRWYCRNCAALVPAYLVIRYTQEKGISHADH